MLTDKTKKAFEKWYRLRSFKSKTQPHIFWFERLPFSMQYGIYIDFFDENGIMIEVSGYYTGTKKRYDYTLRTSERYVGVEYKTRSEARKNAILKANNLFLENNY